MAKNCEEYVLAELDNTRHELDLQKKKNQELIDEIKSFKRERDELVNAARVLAIITDKDTPIICSNFAFDDTNAPKEIVVSYYRAVAFVQSFDYLTYDRENNNGKID